MGTLGTEEALLSDDLQHRQGAEGPERDGSAPETPLPEPPLTVHLGYRPRKSADVLELDMGDGLILYNHDGDLVHHLNPSAGIIWQICDGNATVADLAADIAAEYRLDVETTQREIAAVIAEFDALGLVEDHRRIELRSRTER
jgi:hypothetical protein